MKKNLLALFGCSALVLGSIAACGDEETPPAGTPTLCDTYCGLMATNCTDSNSKYTDSAACQAACGTVATTGADGDTSGNNIQCRIYHAGVPAANAPVNHCTHAVGVADGNGANPCAPTLCDTYCGLMATNCTGDNSKYTDSAACQKACGTVATTGTDGDETGNTLQCRTYHAGVPAATTPVNHCAHAVGVADGNGGNPCQ